MYTFVKTTQFTEAQIVSILRQHEKGVKASDIARSNGISEKTFYRWRSKYGGMEINDLKRLKELETENARLKKLLAEQVLENEVIKDVLRKKW